MRLEEGNFAVRLSVFAVIRSVYRKPVMRGRFDICDLL